MKEKAASVSNNNQNGEMAMASKAGGSVAISQPESERNISVDVN
jgi:hypothetical protein